MEVLGEHVKIRCQDGVELNAYLSRPADTSSHPAIIVIHEAWGLNDQIRGVARRYSEQGYVALAPHLFGRSGDLLTEANIESVMKLMWTVPLEKRNDPGTIQGLMANATEQQKQVFTLFFLGREGMERAMLGDLVSCADYLRSSSHVQGDRIGVTGFCMGGGLAYQLAASYPIKAAVPFYGANPKPIESVAGISGAVLGIYAGNDARINAGIPQLLESMLRNNKDFGIRVFQGMEHAFFNETRPVYDPQRAAEAWKLALSFFNEHLR
jgi:carboxymethylenebutenolidase